MNDEIIRFAYDLCRIPSVTGDEARVQKFLLSRLSDFGLIVEKIPVDEERFNIFAYSAKRSHYAAIFCTHIDTVAPFIEPKIDVDNHTLLGRGACDAKGILSAMTYAMLKERALGFDDLALLFTVGEEESSDGAKICNEVLKGRAHFVVVGEPTELKSAYGQKGTLVFDLVAQGIEAHSAKPHLGDSAIHKLIRDSNKLLSYSWPKDECFGDTLINLGEISGGYMRNVLASSAMAKGIMRTSTASTELVAVLKNQLSDGVSIKIKSSSEPFLYFVPSGFDSFLAGFGSDAPYLHDVGKLILLGPGSLDYAHKQDERIGFQDIHDGVLAYQNVARQARALVSK